VDIDARFSINRPVRSYRPLCSPMPWTIRSRAHGSPAGGHRRTCNGVPSAAGIWIAPAGNRSFSGDSAAGALAADPRPTNPGGRYSPARLSKSSEAELMQ
jgi:hypothetical protein